MKKLSVLFFVICVGLLSGSSTVLAEDFPPSDLEIKKILIEESIFAYPGNCPCPYNRASNGSRCGKRSAYSKPGGYSPLCYPEDVSDEMVRSYREQAVKSQ